MPAAVTVVESVVAVRFNGSDGYLAWPNNTLGKAGEGDPGAGPWQDHHFA
jgi:hypothetical protein